MKVVNSKRCDKGLNLRGGVPILSEYLVTKRGGNCEICECKEGQEDR